MSDYEVKPLVLNIIAELREEYVYLFYMRQLNKITLSHKVQL